MNGDPINPYQSPAADDLSAEPVLAESLERQAVMCHIAEPDLIAWTEHFLRHSAVTRSQLRRAIVILAPLFLFVLLMLAGSLRDRLTMVTVAVLLACSLVAAVSLLPGFQRRVAVRHTRRLYQQGKARNIMGDVRYEIEPHSLRRETHYGQSTFYWQGVEGLEEGPEHLFILISVGSAFIVPYRDFDDAEHRASFLASCRRYYEAARDAPLPEPPWRRRG